MKNPLELVKGWFVSVNEETRKDFIGLSSLYFKAFDLEHNDFLDADNPAAFMKYIGSAKLSNTEKITRVLTLKGFISFTLESRDSEKDWEQAK